MSVLTKYTCRCLKKNRVRTLVTFIGIVLSVALFAAVAEGAYSGQQYMLNVIKNEVGSYHAKFQELSGEELDLLRTQAEIQQVETIEAVGVSLVTPEQDYSYLMIGSMSEGFPDLVSVRIKEGRLPENSNELLIPAMAQAQFGGAFQVGQTLRLDVGQRYDAKNQEFVGFDGYPNEEEELVELQKQVYTVVGIYEEFGYELHLYPSGFLALTTGVSGENYQTFFTMKEPDRIYTFLKEHFPGKEYNTNSEFLLISGVSEDQIVLSVFANLIAILFGLIAFGSIVLIYNAFSISVSERTRQFGMLKSIGATKRQIRRSVLFEALLLSIVAIPLGLLLGCGGIGLTLHFLQASFNRIIPGNIPIRLVLNLPALALAGGIALLTTLISAWIPAQRAARLSPISAIRQSRDVKIRAKKIRVSKLTGKLFGFSGTLAAKNFKRSRRQYRATVLSLFLSVLLFVSASSFSDYLVGNVGGSIDWTPADVTLEVMPADSAAELNREALLNSLLAKPSVIDGVYAERLWVNVDSMAPEAINKELLQIADVEDVLNLDYNLYYVPEDYYAALCKEAGLDPALKQALAYVNGTISLQRPEGSVRMQYTLFESEAFPLRLPIRADRRPEDFSIVDWARDEDGNHIESTCVRNEDLNEDGTYDPKAAFVLPPEAFEETLELTVGGMLKNAPLVAPRYAAPCFYLPISLLPQAGAEEPERWYFASQHLYYFLNAPEHEKAAQAAEELLLPLCNSDKQYSYNVYDNRADRETVQALILILNVFSFGFIILISLIAVANVFNTMSTNISLRRREFATLKSVGMGNRAFGRMMRFECLLYGCKALLWGLPISVGVSWLIFGAVDEGFRNGGFRLPWLAMTIASGSVFLVVFVTMLYAMRRIKKDNPIDALKTETI